MAICPGCNKFPALSTDQEPEVGDLEALVECLDEKAKEKEYRAHVTGTVRIVLTSECCSEEIKEATFDIDVEDVDLEKAKDCECKDWTVDVQVVEDGSQVTDRSETFKTRIAKRGPDKGKEIKVPIPGRYQKRFYGVEMELLVQCACGKQIGEAKFEDECQAGSMDELV